MSGLGNGNAGMGLGDMNRDGRIDIVYPTTASVKLIRNTLPSHCNSRRHGVVREEHLLDHPLLRNRVPPGETPVGRTSGEAAANEPRDGEARWIFIDAHAPTAIAVQIANVPSKNVLLHGVLIASAIGPAAATAHAG